jgi:hydrogenase-4 component E
VEKLAATSPAGVLLDLSGVLILLLAFACLGSKLFNRYVAYYGAQSVVLSFAAAVVAWTFHSIELWILAGLTLAVKGIGIPVTTRRLLVRRLALSRDIAISTGLSTSLIAGGALTAFAYLVTRPELIPRGVVAAAVVPLSTAVILLGALAMVVRRHTVAQLIGWLIVENGVFLGAITLVATFPFIVEAGIFLDVAAGVLIMLVFVSGLTRQLAEASAGELRGLRGCPPWRSSSWPARWPAWPPPCPAPGPGRPESPARPAQPSRWRRRSSCWPRSCTGRRWRAQAVSSTWTPSAASSCSPSAG